MTSLIITTKCTCLQYGAKQTMGSGDEDGDNFFFGTEFSVSPFGFLLAKISDFSSGALQDFN